MSAIPASSKKSALSRGGAAAVAKAVKKPSDDSSNESGSDRDENENQDATTNEDYEREWTKQDTLNGRLTLGDFYQYIKPLQKIQQEDGMTYKDTDKLKPRKHKRYVKKVNKILDKVRVEQEPTEQEIEQLKKHSSSQRKYISIMFKSVIMLCKYNKRIRGILRVNVQEMIKERMDLQHVSSLIRGLEKK